MEATAATLFRARSCREISEQIAADLEANRCNVSPRYSNFMLRWLTLLMSSIHGVLFGNKLCFLFPLVPLAIVADHLHVGNAWIFVISFLGLAPLAERLGFLTEQMAFHTGDTVGGLLNATCGNATEMIIGILALHQGKNDIVKYSLLGSVLSNLLLVMGTSLFFGGITNMKKPQKFDKCVTGLNMCLLTMASVCLMLPMAIDTDSNDVTVGMTKLRLSRAISIVMLVSYTGYLFFQLKTHRQIFEQTNQTSELEEEEEASLGLVSAIVWLCIMTSAIAILSHYVVDTIQEVAMSWNISANFISMILLPIVGNAAEHAGAVLFAFKNKLDLSLGVALGSATQVALFLIPFMVMVGWVINKPMDLEFHLTETLLLFGSVVISANALQDGTSNYMKGLVLVLFYIIISLVFFLVKYSLTITPVTAFYYDQANAFPPNPLEESI